MFARVNVPMLGVIENMSYLIDPQNPENKIQVFPKGDLKQFVDAQKVPLLAEIPMMPDVAMACEMGIPYTAQKSGNAVADAFANVAKTITDRF